MTTAGPDMGVAGRDALPLLDAGSLDPLLDRIGDARHVLVGGASHGTAEYQRWRARLTRRLVTERGFSVLAVADDRPYHPEVFGWWDALRTVVDWVREHRPDHLRQTRNACSALEGCLADPTRCTRAPRLAPPECAEELVRLLMGRWRRAHEAAPERRGGSPEHGGPASLGERTHGPERTHGACGTGLDLTGLPLTPVALDAAGGAGHGGHDGLAHYYRVLLGGGVDAWNLHQRRLADAVEHLRAHPADGPGPGRRAAGQHGDPGSGRHPRVVVWTHDALAGDARGTGRTPRGDLLSLGRLVREQHGAADTVLVGFASHAGTVTASGHWGGPPEVLDLPAAAPGSLEDRLHQTLPLTEALFLVPEEQRRPGWLREPIDHREVGAVYRPERESGSDYVTTVLGQRFDALFYLDRTGAQTPPYRPDGPHHRPPERL